MAKKKMDLRETNVMTVSNGFITAKYDGKMSLNAMKLLRLTLTQCRMTDKDFFEYEVRVPELAQMFKITGDSIYRETDKITTQMLKTLLYVGDGNPKHPYKKYAMFSKCEYDGAGTLTIRLSEEMKPLLLELRGNFTKIPIGNLVTMRSKYSMKLYELISMELRNAPTYGDKKQTVYLELTTIRTVTGTEDKLKQIVQLKERVIDVAVKEINESGIGWDVTYTDRKEGRKIAGFDFTIKSKYYKEPTTEQEQELLDRAKKFKALQKNKTYQDDQLNGQLRLLPDGKIV